VSQKFNPRETDGHKEGVPRHIARAGVGRLEPLKMPTPGRTKEAFSLPLCFEQFSFNIHM
jgi:hypothetical protein